MPKIERWLPVAGWEGFYEVSDLGSVKSLGRFVPNKYSKENRLYGKVLSGGCGRGGYYHVTLHNGGKKETRKIHQLVMESFVGECPLGLEIAHNDGNPKNNKLSNLRYATRSSNQMDRVAHGTSNRGERHALAKLKEHQVLEIRSLASELSNASLSKKYGVSPKTIINILNRKIWKHI